MFNTPDEEPNDPRDKCCWQGKYFFDAFKAIFTRVLFSLHAMIAIWQVTLVTHKNYWLLTITYVGLLIETFVVLLKKRGQEWRWFQFSIMFFLCTTVPPIWILELTKLGRWGSRLNVTDFGEPAQEDSSNSGSQLVVIGSLNTAAWTVILEQGLVVVIVIGRWMMPKGELSRDELSSLLLIYLGTAADIIDFLSLLSEPNIVRTGTYLYAVLAIWTVSLLQFPFVVTATAKNDEEVEQEEKALVDYDSSGKYAQSKGAIKRALKARLNWFEAFIETEMWGIFVSLALQDGPFVVMRVIALFVYKIITYTNYFFTIKNALVLMLQVYRMVAIFIDYKRKKKQLVEDKKVVHISKLYVNAFKFIRNAKPKK